MRPKQEEQNQSLQGGVILVGEILLEWPNPWRIHGTIVYLPAFFGELLCYKLVGIHIPFLPWMRHG